MNMIEELKKYGANVPEALERFMGNEALYEKTLKKFPAAAETHEVLEYMKNGDYETALSNAHSLKGVTGNLSLTPLYNAYAEIVNDLRAGDNAKARAGVEKVLPLQKEIIDCIKSEDKT